MRARIAVVLAVLGVPATAPAAGRVIVVGALAVPVADALRLELDPFGMQVDARPDGLAPADLPLDEAFRFDVLAAVAEREAATNVAEVVVDGANAVVLCLRGDDRARRTVPVSTPPSESDHRAIALVLRSMLQETDVPVVPEGSPATDRPSPTAAQPRAAPAVVRPEAAAESVLSAAVGWSGWARADGDFLFHGPSAQVRVEIATWLALDAHGAFSFESTVTTSLAEVRSQVLAFGATALFPLVARERWRVLAGPGADLQLVSSTALRNGRETDRSAVAPVLAATATADFVLVGAWVLRPTVRFGYALEKTRWLVRGAPTVEEGAWAVEVAFALAVRF